MDFYDNTESCEISLNVLTVQELLGRFGCNDITELVMDRFVEPLHADQPLAVQRREGIRMRLCADIHDAMLASTWPSSATLAVTPNDMSALRILPWEESLSLPVLFPSDYSEERLKELAASSAWEMLEGVR